MHYLLTDHNRDNRFFSSGGCNVESFGHSMFLSAFDQVLNEFRPFTADDQLEFRFLQRRFLEEQNHLSDCHHHIPHFHRSHDFRSSSRFQRQREGSFDETSFDSLTSNDFQFRIVSLTDNQPSDQYFYEFVVFTGQRPQSGTKSNVKH